jgi:hypothetical protein
MHPVARRIYEAVQVLIRADDMPPPSRVASEANVSQQTLKNWESRGPSAQGVLDFQLTHGVSATWLLTGYGPLMVGGGKPTAPRVAAVAEPTAQYHAWPFTPELLARLAGVGAEERRRLENGCLLYTSDAADDRAFV